MIDMTMKIDPEREKIKLKTQNGPRVENLFFEDGISAALVLSKFCYLVLLSPHPSEIVRVSAPFVCEVISGRLFGRKF